MNKYLYFSPRGFANEYGVFAVDQSSPKAREQAETLITKCSNSTSAEAHYITRRDADRMTAGNRQKYRTGEANYCNPAGATEIQPIADWYREDE